MRQLIRQLVRVEAVAVVVIAWVAGALLLWLATGAGAVPMAADDDDLPIRALRDCVPDGQAVRWKVETVGTWQRVCFRKRVGKSWDWFLEQVEDHLMGGVPEWLRQSFKFVPGSVREAKDPVTHWFPTPPPVPRE
jgi:hypothetical protein